MRPHIATFIKDLIAELRQRREIRLLIEAMENDARTLEDIGLTLEQFAERQWQDLNAGQRARRALWRSRASRTFNARFPWRVLPDSLTLHRTPSVH